jgi:serine/threonine protein kinase
VADVLEPGLVVAGYRLVRLLGQGGMGVVYEAVQMSLDRTVALKIVAPALGKDVTFRERFRREGLIQARLEHSNIVTVYEAGEFQGTLFLAMRLVRGQSLKDMIAGGDLDTDRTLRILRPVADALDSAHEAGLIHRDVKPHNILVGARDHPYLADFGLTKGTGATTAGFTRTGEFLGSLDYISPEQVRGEPATSASDIYALGAVLFECLSGVVPYPRESEAAVLYAHVAEPPPRITGQHPALPASLDPVLERALAKEPSARPATALELIAEAEQAFSQSVPQVPQVTGAAESAKERRAPSPATAPGTVRSFARNATALATAALRRRSAPTKRSAEPTVSGPPQAPTVSAAPKAATVAGPSQAAGASTVIAPVQVTGLGRQRTAVILAVAVAGVVGVGFLVGHAGAPKPRASIPGRTVNAGDVALTVPTAWREPAASPSIPGLPFTRNVSLKDGVSGGVLLAGLLPSAGGDHLLSVEFMARLKRVPSTKDTVRLGDATAYRYRELDVRGLTTPLTLLVLPTTGGVVGLGCVAPPSGRGAFMGGCEKAAGTLRLRGRHALPLGPDPAYGRILAEAVAALRASQSTANALAAARTRGGQAMLSRRLASAPASAAAALSAASPGPDAAGLNASLVAALRGVSDGYVAMARAAGAGQAGAYATARDQTRHGLAAAREELAALRAAGYGT